MNFIKNSEKIQRLKASVRKYRLPLILFWAGMILGLMSFVSGPKKDEIINIKNEAIKSLKQDYNLLLNDLKTWQSIAVQAIKGRRSMEQKVKELEDERDSLISVPAKEIRTIEIREKKVKEELSHEDSLVIYQDVVGKMLHKNIKPIRVR